MKTQGTILVCCTVIMLISSCKKNSDKRTTCRIVTVTQSSSGTSSAINITYNNDGKISTLNTSSSGTSTSKVFTYSGNTIIINTASGTFTSRDSVTLDAKGRALNIRQFSDLTGNNWTNLRFEYNGNDLLKYHQTSDDDATEETTVAASSNGNMVGIQSSSSNTTLEYFTDKKVQPGDYLEIATLIQYGVSIYPHKNLVKTIDGGSGNITNFNYEFDADGRITKLIGTGGSSSTTLTYQYQCN
jgi:hypothetical protein